jgi:2-haloacid dehalogenase
MIMEKIKNHNRREFLTNLSVLGAAAVLPISCKNAVQKIKTNKMDTSTLAFDVYGTLINTSGVYTSLQKLVGDKAKLFVDTWRNKQLEYSYRQGLMNRFEGFSTCTKYALDYTCDYCQISLTSTQKAGLLNEYKVLPAFSDVKECFPKLINAGHRLFAFSNGEKITVTNLLKNADILHFFEGVVSVEKTKVFKPSPIVYKHFNDVTNSKKEQSWLISGNPFDVIGALSYGMKSAWVQRTKETIWDPWTYEPTVTINQLTELHSKLAQE